MLRTNVWLEEFLRINLKMKFTLISYTLFLDAFETIHAYIFAPTNTLIPRITWQWRVKVYI